MVSGKPRRDAGRTSGLTATPAKRQESGAKLAKMLQKPGESGDVSAADLRHNSAEIVSRVAVGGQRVVLTRNRKPVAAIVPMSDLAVLKKLPKRSSR